MRVGVGAAIVSYVMLSPTLTALLKSNGRGPMRGDLKAAWRNLRTRPLFSLMVIGMLALGIGGNAAIFSIFNSLFVRPLPFTDSGRLVDLDETAPKWSLSHVGVSTADSYEWRISNSTFDSIAFFR